MDKTRIYLEIIFACLVIFFQHSSAILEYDRDDDGPSWSRCPMIRHKLKNGRVKIRSRGRIAKFQCDSDYDLAGERFATCVRGQWNNPIPHCVTRGCGSPRVPNSRAFEMFRGALIKYKCMPGFSLTVGQTVKNVDHLTIYCDGRKWIPAVPKCEVSILEPKTSCDFESTDLCGWSQDPTHDFDWKRNQYATPSGHVGTGPTYDHTFGAGRGGVYLYLETSAPRKLNDIARLYSPVYSADYSGGCFVFWYHMYGQSTGGLKVYIKTTSDYFYSISPIWSLYGEQGNEWLRGNISVPLFKEGFQIIIEGIRGNGYVGDTAIDDVSLTQDICENVGNSNETESDLDSSSCRGRCKEPPKPGVCGCDDDCAYDRNCCDDLHRYCSSSSETTDSETHEEHSRQTSTAGTTESNEQGEIVSNVTSFATDSSSLTSTPSSSSFTSTAVSPLLTPAIPFSPMPSVSTKSTTVTTVSSISVSPITIPATTTTTAAPTTTTSAPITSTAKLIAKTTEPNTSTSTTTTIPTTTTPVKTTTTPAPTTTTPAPTTTTTASTTTALPPTTTALPPTTTALPPTTTALPPTSAAPTTIITTTTSSTPIPTIKQSTTIPSTTTVASVPVQVSTASASTTITESIFIVTQPPERFPMRPIPASGIYSRYETIPPTTYNVPETRKTYNLRPRYRTASTTAMTRPRLSRYTISPYPMITSTKRAVPATPTTLRYFTTVSPVPITKKVPYSSTSTQRSKFKLTTDGAPAYKDAHASKAASKTSDEGHSVVTIVSVTVVVMVGVGVAVVLLLRRWWARKQSKLADDSEMRFLSENEVIEFSDASALDRHTLHQPLI